MAIDVAEHAIVKEPVDPQHHKANGVREHQMQIVCDDLLHFFACGASPEGGELDLCGNDRDRDADDRVAEEQDASHIIAARSDVQAAPIPASVHQCCSQGKEYNDTSRQEKSSSDEGEQEKDGGLSEHAYGRIGDETGVHLCIQQSAATAGI